MASEGAGRVTLLSTTATLLPAGEQMERIAYAERLAHAGVEVHTGVDILGSDDRALNRPWGYSRRR